MHIHAITPIHVAADEVARRQARYDAVSPLGVRITLHDIGPDAPRSLQTDDDVRRSDEMVSRALASAPAGTDAVLPDCVLDPGVPAPGAALGQRPVLGLLRLTVGAAVAAGHRVGAVARNPAIAAELAARIEAYGWSDAFDEVTVLDLDVADIQDSRRWAEAVRPALRRARERGTTAVVNGCSAVDVGPDEPGLPLLLDPVAVGLGTLGALHRR